MSGKQPAITGTNGFVRARRANGRHLTLTVEGMDGKERSVAAVALERTAVDKLIARLQHIRKAWITEDENREHDRITKLFVQKVTLHDKLIRTKGQHHGGYAVCSCALAREICDLANMQIDGRWAVRPEVRKANRRLGWS